METIVYLTATQTIPQYVHSRTPAGSDWMPHHVDRQFAQRVDKWEANLERREDLTVSQFD